MVSESVRGDGRDEQDRRRSFVAVDLTAIRDNAAILRKHIPQDTTLAAVVKADGYGHGDVAVARAALDGGASWLCVATVSEGIALRRAGFDTVRILVLGPLAVDEVSALVAWNLTPTVDDSSPVGEITECARRLGCAPYHIHVKVDTGLHRFGVPAHELGAFLARLRAMDAVHVEGLSSHFATADAPNDPYLHEQARRFAQIVDALDQAGLRPPIIHLSNSGAVLQQVAPWDMVRVGIALYGIPPSEEVPLIPGMRPVMAVWSAVARVITLDTGAAVGYGRRYVAAVPHRAALVPLGYADGLPRALTNAGAVFINGARCPIIGAVSMDQCVVAIPDPTPVSVGDRVVIVGAEQRITELARDANTISYELAVRFGARMRRVYDERQ